VSAARLAMRGVRKAFGPVCALDGVDLEVARGEVHALLGENGAGKSTLMKVLFGALAPDAGTIALDGEPYAPSGPRAARERGVAMIHQELCLAHDLTVAQNVFLGREPARRGLLRRGAMRARVAGALERLGHPELAPDARVGDLAPALRQLVEIARALVFEARVVVLDEPTSSLSQADAEHLFTLVRRLAAEGVSVVYISHFLEEVQKVATRFTVLRDGRTVGVGAVATTPLERVVALMAGRSLDELFPRRPRAAGDVRLAARGLAGARLLREASFELRAGEVLGLAGLVGAGRTELLRVLAGLDPARGGEARLGGERLGPADPRRRLARGIGLVSEDRKRDGLLLARSVATNATISHLAPLARAGWIRRGAQDAAAGRWIERLGIRCRGPRQALRELSGGNQQKVALARLLHRDVDVLLLDEPTRGVDVGAKVEIYRAIGELAARGKGIVMVSSYLPELLGVCDRIAVMHRGRLGRARPVAEWSEDELLDEASRGPREARA